MSLADIVKKEDINATGIRRPPKMSWARLFGLLFGLLFLSRCGPAVVEAEILRQDNNGSDRAHGVLGGMSSTSAVEVVKYVGDEEHLREGDDPERERDAAASATRELCSGPRVTCKNDYQVVAKAGRPIPQVLRRLTRTCPGAPIRVFQQSPPKAIRKGSIEVTLTVTDSRGRSDSCSTMVKVLKCGKANDCSNCIVRGKRERCVQVPTGTVCTGADNLCGSVYTKCCDGLICREVGGGIIDLNTGQPFKECMRPDDQQCILDGVRCDNVQNPECCSSDRVCRKKNRRANFFRCLPPRKKTRRNNNRNGNK